MGNGEKTIRALLVEDDFGFANLLEEWLTDVYADGQDDIHPSRIQFVQVDSLGKALWTLRSQSFDILLIDLNLPDSKGLDTFNQFSDYISIYPIIVLSGLDDASLANQAVRRGAQDYLVKNAIDGQLLIRAIRYALERHALHQELDRIRESERREREQGSLDRLVDAGLSKVSAHMLGLQDLRFGSEDVFNQHVNRFGDALEKLLQMRTHKVCHDVSEDMKKMARDLGFLKCGPRDVVDIYKAALIRWRDPGNLIKNEAIHEESRYLAFELMGHLVSFYRPYALGGYGKGSDHEKTSKKN